MKCSADFTKVFHLNPAIKRRIMRGKIRSENEINNL